jgi:hypothetical protein
MDVGIRAFVGPNGSGKTLGAVVLNALPAWRRGIPVVSNMTLDPAAIGLDPALFIPLTTWRQIPELRDCVLIVDEIQATFPSRESARMPAELARMLNQLRKPNVQLVWTGPAWARADLIIRECTQYVTLCRGMLPDRMVRQPGVVARFPPALKVDGRAQRVETTGWLPNRLFRYVTFDATAFEEFTLGKAEKLRPMSRRFYWRTAHPEQACYVTGEQVSLLDHIDEFGTCMQCGGNRRRPACSCGERHDTVKGRQARNGGGRSTTTQRGES